MKSPSEVDETTFDSDKLPERGGFTGKLPKEFIDSFLKDAEKFKKFVKRSEKFDIQVPFLVDMAWDEPFFGSLSRRIHKTRTLAVPTAGVRFLDGVLEMLYNPVFFYKLENPNDDVSIPECPSCGLPHLPGGKHVDETLSLPREKKHVKGVLKHEFYHIIFEHITSRKQSPHVLWNIATDEANNSLIPRDELPEWVIMPGELCKPKDGSKPSLVALKVSKHPKGMHAEWYMAELLADPDIQKAMKEAKKRADAGAPCKQPGKGAPGDGSDPGDSDSPGEGDDPGGQGRFERELRKELYGDGGAGQFDDHDMWDELDETQRDMARDFMRDILRDCVREAENSAKGWGSIPDSIRAHLKSITSNEVDWRDLLANFVGRSKSTDHTSSIKRINRRYPWDHPGRKRSYTAHLAAAVDESGSMHDQWIELLFAELSNLGNLTSYDILPFDTQVNEVAIQRLRRGQKPVFERAKCGGTDFNAPVKFVNEKMDLYDALLILTDGQCFKPEKCRRPVAYIMAPGCKLMFDPGDALVITMTDVRKKE